MDKKREIALTNELILLRATCDVLMSAVAMLMAQQGADVDESLKQLQAEVKLREEHYRQAKPKGGSKFSGN